MDGSFDEEFSPKISRAEQFRAFKALAKREVYSARPVIGIEACGFEVMGGLPGSFVGALETKARNLSVGKVRSRTLLGLMPEIGADLSSLTNYDRTLLATDFVAGMTDSFAVGLDQRLRGISLPWLREIRSSTLRSLQGALRRALNHSGAE